MAVRPPALVRRLWARIPERTKGRLVLVFGVFFWAFALIIMPVLVAKGFGYVSFDEIALKKNAITNVVEVEGRVYTSGRYWLGVPNTFLTFPATAQEVLIKDDDEAIDKEGKADAPALEIFNDNGVETRLDISFYYKLRPHEVGALYRRFANSYHTQIVSVAVAALKNTAPQFTADEFNADRASIRAEMEQAVREALDTIHVDVPLGKFALRRIRYPENIDEIFLAAALQREANARQQEVQQAVIIRAETERFRQEIAANITRITADASADARVIRDRATAEAERMVREARVGGQKAMFERLGMTSAADQHALVRLDALVGNDALKVLDNDLTSTPLIQI